jgi:hypothetical protein
MKNFFDKLYASVWGRLARRFAIAGISAVIAWAITTGKIVVTPESLVNSVLALTGQDLIEGLKLFVGAGFIAAIDKLRREGTWSWFTEPTSGK